MSSQCTIEKKVHKGLKFISEPDLYLSFLKLGYQGDPAQYFSFQANSDANGLILFQKNGKTIDAENFDKALREINNDYNNDRNSGMVHPLEIVLINSASQKPLQSKPTLIHTIKV